MNKRIQELIKECEITSTSYFHGRGNITDTYFDREKFAKLIVQECIQQIERVGILENIEFESGMIADSVKEHFGVEK